MAPGVEAGGDGSPVEAEPVDDRTLVDRLLDDSALTRLHVRVWLLAAMGIMLDGFDFFIVGVAIPLIKEDFEPTPSAFQIGLVSSAAVVGAIFGAVIIGRLADRLGRSLVFKIDLAMFVVFALLSALAPSIWWLILFRFLLGVGVGADYPIAASYVTEIAPRRYRSRLLVGAFAFQAVGQIMGVAVGLVVLNLWPDPGSWRLMLAFGVIPAAIIVVLRRGVPESPKWLAHVGKLQEAATVCSAFCGRTVTVAEMEEAAGAASHSVAATERRLDQLVEASGDTPPDSDGGDAGRARADRPDPMPLQQQSPYRELFGRGMRRRTVLTTVPWFLMDIATYGVGVFTPTIIAAIGVSATASAGVSTFIADDIASTKGSLFVDIFLVVGFGLALLLINRIRHITLQVVGFVAMALGLGLLAYTSSLPGGGDGNLALVFIGFGVFNLFMNMGPNSVTFILPAEVFPTKVRATGHGLAAACGKAGAAVGSFSFAIVQSDLGLSTTLLLIAGGCTIAAGITYLFRVDVRERAA